VPRPRTRPIRSSSALPQTRGSYFRTTGNMLLNEPDGFPSSYPPVWWVGSDQNYGGPVAPASPYSVQMLPAVARLVSLITDPLSTVPWRVIEDGFGGETLDTPKFIEDPQLLRPDDRWPSQALPATTRMPRSAFYAAWIRQAALAGSSAIAFLEDSAGLPLAGSLRLLDTMHLSTTRDLDGVLCWQLGAGGEQVTFDRDGRAVIGGLVWRLALLRDPHSTPDAEGHVASVFERHPTAFGLSGEVDRYMAGTFASSGTPSGVLSVSQPSPITQEQADSLKQNWMAAHGGSRRSVAVLASTVGFTPISASPVDVAMIESKRANLVDLAYSFCMDSQGALGVSMGGAGGSLTYANIQSWFSKLKSDLVPWITAVEQTVSALLPAGRSVRMDFSEYSKPDPEQQYAALKVAVDAGLMTIDEARNILGLAPMPQAEPEPVSAPSPVPAPAPVPVPAPVPEPEPIRALRSTQAWRR